MAQPPVTAPARFAPIFAVGYSAEGGALSPVSDAAPLPVAFSQGATPASLEGVATGAVLAGPFVPAPGKPVSVILSGLWAGSVAVVRSVDGGLTVHPLTVAGEPWARFGANACEQVWEEHDPAAELYLDIAVTAGDLSYRMGH